MDAMDAMDTDAPVPEAQDLPGGATTSSSSSSVAGPGHGHEGTRQNARDLLGFARQLIDQGKPSQALQEILIAIRSEGGEQAVLEYMHRAQERYCNRLQEISAADELASLFAECAIAEAQPTRSQPVPPPAAGPSIILDANETSILAMTGRKQIMLDAFADGSSFVCLQCGGLVSNLRKDEHLAYWCSPT